MEKHLRRRSFLQEERQERRSQTLFFLPRKPLLPRGWRKRKKFGISPVVAIGDMSSLRLGFLQKSFQDPGKRHKEKEIEPTWAYAEWVEEEKGAHSPAVAVQEEQEEKKTEE